MPTHQRHRNSSSKALWVQGSSTCAHVNCFAEDLLCLYPLWGRVALRPPRPPLSVISTPAPGAPEPLSTPPAPARQEVVVSNSKCRQTFHFPFPSPAGQAGMPGKGQGHSQCQPCPGRQWHHAPAPREGTADSRQPQHSPEQQSLSYLFLCELIMFF